MSGRSITLLILLGAIGLGIACLWIQWYILWAIPILIVIFWASQHWDDFLAIVAFAACIGILGLLIAYCGWHTCWIVPVFATIIWAATEYHEQRCHAEEQRKEEQQRKEEEQLAEEQRKEKERIFAERLREAERIVAENRREAQRLAEEKRKEEEERLAEEKRKEAERLAAEDRKIALQQLSDEQKTLDTLTNSFDNIFSRRILFDSNIWMNSNYDDLFAESFASIKKMNSQIMMPGIQLDEIENLKNSSDDTKKYAARCALKRIELAQQEGILALSGVGVDSKKYAYADPEFIKYLLHEAAELPEFSGSVFVTDDRALRIRINAVVKEQLGKEILVLSGEDLFEMVVALASEREVVDLYKEMLQI